MRPGVEKVNLLSLFLSLFLFFPSFVVTHGPQEVPCDLAVERITYRPGSPKPGGLLRVRVVVRNRGGGGYRGDLEVKLLLDGKEVAARRVDASLEPQGERAFIFRVFLPREGSRVVLEARVLASREPQDRWGNNTLSVQIQLGREKRRQWELVKFSPAQVDMGRGRREVEAWFRRGSLEKGMAFLMVVKGGGKRWTVPGRWSLLSRDLVRVVFPLSRLSLPTGFFRGEFLLQGRGWTRRFPRGPTVVNSGGERKERGDFVPREALVAFPPGKGMKGRLRVAVERAGGRVVEERRVGLLGMVVLLVRFPRGWEGYEAWKRELEGRYAGVEVERNRLFRTLGKREGDPLEGLQYYRRAVSLDLPENAGGEVKVGVVDTGFDLGHRDLKGAVFERWDLVRGKGKGFANESHGTEVLGVLGARCGNGIGICGLAPFARIYYVRACWEAGGRGETTTFVLLKALDLLASRTPDVVNMSLGGGYDSLLERALKALTGRGVLVVAASSRVRGRPGYPAAFPFVLGVGALDARGEPFGGGKADLWAPGEDIFTTLPGNDYGFVSGASMAAAIVTAGVARLKRLFPSFSARQLRRMVVGVSRGRRGYPVLDLQRAVEGSGGPKGSR